MKIKFKQIDDNHISIIAVAEKGEEINRKGEHEVGQIFTPSGSAHSNKNAIQICGFSEAFDLWGCAVYGRQGLTKSGILKQDNIVQVKDIQLMFGWDTKEHHTEHHDLRDDCCKCYNNPCTCELNIIHENPYTVKREQDLWLEKVKKNSKK